jgi:hypothetical protein
MERVAETAKMPILVASANSSFTAHRIPTNDDDCDDAQLTFRPMSPCPSPPRGDDAASQGSERPVITYARVNAPRMQAGQPPPHRLPQ